ncbi:MAG: peptidylprolyl isomerase [Myxococcota bacterium]
MRIRQVLAILAVGSVLGCHAKTADTQGQADAKAKGANTPAAVSPGGVHPGLLDPSQANETAPATYKVKFETTQGDIVIEVDRATAPKGADRFYNLVKIGFLNDVAFFRAIKGFMVQFGLNGDPKVNAAWKNAVVQDDPVKGSNSTGAITFAMRGPNTRTTQLFINLVDNNGKGTRPVNLDKMNFASFGKVVEGMDVVEKLYTGYGEGAPKGKGPDQRRVTNEGNAYLKASFPKLDYIKSATLL